MTDYSKGKIYKILNNIDDEIYIGSTSETLSRRMARHRSLANTNPYNKLYKHMVDIGIDKCYIELVETYPCNNKDELRAKEGHVIRQCGTLNSRIECRTRQEWKNEVKEDIKEKSHAYYEHNKEKLQEQHKSYYENHKEHIKQASIKYKEEHKEWKLEYDRLYRLTNKETIKEAKQIRMICECGCDILKAVKARHYITKRHQQFLEQQTQKCKSSIKPDDCNNLMKMD